MEFHTLRLDVERRVELRMISPVTQRVVLEGILGCGVPHGAEVSLQHFENRLVVHWPEYAQLVISYVKNGKGSRYDLHWVGKDTKSSMKDTFEMQKAHWYGGAEIKQQEWLVEKWNMRMAPYVCGDSFKEGQFGGVQERYWFSSNGVAIFVEPEIPLFVSMKSSCHQGLTLLAKYDSPYKNIDSSFIQLKYSILQADNVKAVHEMACNYFIPRPIDIPNKAFFCHPIWSTWAKYKTSIDQETILKFADEITEHGFKAAQLEIDDDWTPAYGDMGFDSVKFPDAKGMIEQLKNKNMPVTAWVHPFASPRSRAFSHNEFMVQSSMPLGNVLRWWNGLGKVLDVTNPAAVTWYSGNLNRLVEIYGLSSFKFDAGEVSYTPRWPSTHVPMRNPSTYSSLYAELAYNLDPTERRQEVRVGFRTQHLPLVVRMMDKDSNWTQNNGLKTLIPHALLFGILGYPFLLPDMVGGNAYGSDFPDRELYIRWMQVNAFMPVIQFSIAPWQYDDEVIRIAHRVMNLREKYSSKMVELAVECTTTGSPIVRPLWWIVPEDDVAQAIDSEFLLGDDILVAPILREKATSRHIYLPMGVWQDELRDEELQGATWYHNYEVALDEVPHFIRISNTLTDSEIVGELEQVGDLTKTNETTPIQNGHSH